MISKYNLTNEQTAMTEQQGHTKWLIMVGRNEDSEI
jgi:hypothetical protein